MAPNVKVAKAFRAMKDLGITEEKVKPVLKSLLKLYEKNWELIEEENYRALADAIFDQEETQVAEQKKKHEKADQMDEEAQMQEEAERPKKRLRLRYQETHVSTASGNSGPSLGGILLKQPKEEVPEQPDSCPQQLSKDIIGSSQPNIEDVRAGAHSVSSQPLIRNKGKLPVSPMSLSVQERFELSQPCAAVRTLPFATGRTESNSVPISPQLRPREKGKEILSPQIARGDKKSISEMSSHAVHLNERAIESSIVLLPSSHSLIKPKDEPITDEMPQFEVPIAVIHPEPLSIENSTNGNGSTREADCSIPIVGEDRSGGVPASSSERRTNCELVSFVDESSSNLDITSSPCGEVKISFTCSSILRRPDFHMPSVDAVLKMVEDKCLRSYKVLDPSVSMMKLLKEMCNSFLELGTDSASETQKTEYVMPAVDILKQYNVLDAFATTSKPFGPSNGSVNAQCLAEAAQLQIPKLSDCTRIDNETTRSNCKIVQRMEENGCEDANSLSLVVVQQRQLTPDDIRSSHDVNDIAKGQEKVVIAVVNDVGSDFLPSFHYIPQNVVFQNAHVNLSLARVGENCFLTCLDDCLSSSTPCACAHETGGHFAYTTGGLVKEDFLEECISMNRDPKKHCLVYCEECPLERSKDDILEACKGHLVRKFIKECWWKCGCSKLCGNRVLQRGIHCTLQVFMTPEGKGWGLRTLEDLPKGAFVCEYAGEILTTTELNERISQSPSSEKHAYPVLLDADWASAGVLKDEEALCLDATCYGNVARFINHRCFDSNLVEIPVKVETPDRHYYHLGFFTTRNVKALEELTWDYGIDFDDHDRPIKTFTCRCGSQFCRNIQRSTSRSRSVATRA